jgi:hypothetical protein
MTIAIPELSLVVLIGASGSGKSTFAARHFKHTEMLSSDFCRGLVTDDENDQSATRAAFEALHFIAGTRLEPVGSPWSTPGVRVPSPASPASCTRKVARRRLSHARGRQPFEVARLEQPLRLGIRQPGVGVRPPLLGEGLPAVYERVRHVPYSPRRRRLASAPAGDTYLPTGIVGLGLRSKEAAVGRRTAVVRRPTRPGEGQPYGRLPL